MEHELVVAIDDVSLYTSFRPAALTRDTRVLLGHALDWALTAPDGVNDDVALAARVVADSLSNHYKNPA